MSTRSTHPTHRMLTRKDPNVSGHVDLDMSVPETKTDLVPMINDVEIMLAKATDGVSEQISEVVKTIESRGGEASFSSALVFRRNEIIAKWDFNCSTD